MGTGFSAHTVVAVTGRTFRCSLSRKFVAGKRKERKPRTTGNRVNEDARENRHEHIVFPCVSRCTPNADIVQRHLPDIQKWIQRVSLEELKFYKEVVTLHKSRELYRNE